MGKKEAQPHNAFMSTMCTGSDPRLIFEEQWINHLPQITKLASFAEGNRVLLRWTMSHGESTHHHCMVSCVHFSQAAAGRSLNLGTMKPLSSISPISRSLESYTQLYTVQHFVLPPSRSQQSVTSSLLQSPTAPAQEVREVLFMTNLLPVPLNLSITKPQRFTWLRIQFSLLQTHTCCWEPTVSQVVFSCSQRSCKYLASLIGKCYYIFAFNLERMLWE